jgi:two-component system chemotaxis response regulator CheB
VLRPGGVWIAPGDFHVTVRRAGTSLVIDTNQNPPENSCRPAVDVLFRSAAETCGAGVLGVVLTGMGQDGMRGSEVLRDAGGRVLVQDEASSVVWGMPGAVAQAGLADEILPLADVPKAICREAARHRAPLACTP